MTNNNKDSSSNVTELRELFELVENGDICVTDAGAKTAFWWNPKSLYETEGSYTSISDFEKSLVADQTCIGYAS